MSSNYHYNNQDHSTAKKIHYADRRTAKPLHDDILGRPACNLIWIRPHPNLLTWDKDKVTCKCCKRTRAFKENVSSDAQFLRLVEGYYTGRYCFARNCYFTPIWRLCDDFFCSNHEWLGDIMLAKIRGVSINVPEGKSVIRKVKRAIRV